MNEEELIAYLDSLLAQGDATRVEGLGEPGSDVPRTLLGPVARDIGFSNDNITQLLLDSSGPGTTPGIRRQQQAIFDAAPVGPIDPTLFRDHPLSRAALSESTGQAESLIDMPQDVTRVAEPRAPRPELSIPRPELSRGENLFRNIVEGLDPTLGLATRWTGMRPDKPDWKIQLAASMFTGGSLLKGSAAVIKKLTEKGSRITAAAFSNLPSVQRIAGAKVATGQRQIVGPAIRIDEDMIITSPHARRHLDLTTDVMSGKGGEAALRRRIEPLYADKIEHSQMFGFIDNKGNFLVPSEAAAVAYDAGQITRRQALNRSGDAEFFGRLSPPNRARSPHRVIDGEDRFFSDLWSEDLGLGSLINRAAGGSSIFSPPIPLSKP
jgi:hypothetical protein